ncbi:AMP-binding protein [Streptomyces sp. PRKS01-65]|nr:fatty acid--CoA ligase family protein [Streptomyces harenosi]NEY32861.1 AMP-binding protein [Streptomyces harenosi]
MPAATLVLHTADGATQTLRPERIAERVSRIRAEFRRAVGPDDSVCLLPDGRAPFPRLLLELVAALGLPNPVVVPDGDAGASSPAHLARLGLTARALGGGPPPDTTGTGERLPPAALLLRTGGTSGRLRYAVNTSMRRALGRDRRLSLAAALRLKDGVRVCLAGSVRHAAQLSMFLDALNHRAEIHLFERPDPARLLHEVRRHRIQWLVATPLHLRIMQRQLRRDGGGTAELETVVHMSAACPEPVKRFWHCALGPENVYEVFGASEGIGTTVARGDEWEKRPGTVGRGFFTSVAVRDSAGRPLPPGATGDVYFHGGTPERALHIGQRDLVRWTGDGYVSIGDRGRIDPDGYLYLEPRPQLRITVGGTTVLATDIEDALLDVAWIEDAAAAGVANDVTGQRVVCFVVCATAGPESRKAELIAGLRRVLPPAAVPRRVIEVEAIPRSPSGKINRTSISAWAQQYSARETEQ